MKKLLIVLLVLALTVFAGCKKSDEIVGDDADSNAISTITDETESTSDDTQDNENQEEPDETEENVDYKIDESYFECLGKDPDSVAEIKGTMSESIWENGPLYRFGAENVWYAFSQYDFDENNNYVALGECSQIIVPLSSLLATDICDVSALEDAIGKVLSKEADEMDGGYAFWASYKDYSLVLYEESEGAINGNTMVTIRK